MVNKKWSVDDGGDGEIMIWDGTDAPYIAEVYEMEHAQRIVACFNACTGIPTDKLEAGANPSNLTDRLATALYNLRANASYRDQESPDYAESEVTIGGLSKAWMEEIHDLLEEYQKVSGINLRSAYLER